MKHISINFIGKLNCFSQELERKEKRKKNKK